MIDRLSMGVLPDKPHTVLRGPDGALVYEEMFTRNGFDGPFTYFYHRFPTTAAREVKASNRGYPKATEAKDGAFPLKRRLYDTNAAPLANKPQLLDNRVPLLFNDDLVVLSASATEVDDVYFANNDGDELWFVRGGRGRLESPCGFLTFGPGDYVHVPRSLIHRWHPDTSTGEPLSLFGIEARGDVGIPPSFRNPVGQLQMNAPYTHRDFVRPVGPIASFEATPDGPTTLIAKRDDRFTELSLERCPMDVIGWDGTVYPFAFPIEKYQPKTGAVHLPPTVHLTFSGQGFVVCSFVPRVTDYHPNAIPCPYPHSNVHCDEVLLYVRGNFTSRKGVGPGSMSLHPRGVAHGPHPGSYEKSIGTVHTDEMAVMIDTWKGLVPTEHAVAVENAAYHDSWRITSAE
jgi:homogentisate 1,2-dioxygenase